MSASPFLPIKQHVVKKLKADLPLHLTYHSLSHTLDVLEQVQVIALAEGVVTPTDLFLLKVAALYHDTGYLTSNLNHEALGCELAKLELPALGLHPEQIDVVCTLIKATKMPQTPLTYLEQIICDADLDYLGRTEYSPKAESLFKELVSLGLLETEEEWNNLQVQFLEHHHYFTAYAQENREPQKQANLRALKNKLLLVQQTISAD